MSDTTVRRLWDTGEYANFMGISVAAAEQERAAGGGPAYIKAGRRVRYDPEDVFAWINANKQRPGAA